MTQALPELCENPHPRQARVVSLSFAPLDHQVVTLRYIPDAHLIFAEDLQGWVRKTQGEVQDMTTFPAIFGERFYHHILPRYMELTCTTDLKNARLTDRFTKCQPGYTLQEEVEYLFKQGV